MWRLPDVDVTLPKCSRDGFISWTVGVGVGGESGGGGDGQAVVALESTIISHGMPYPTNVAMANEVESIVRAEGAVR